MSKIKRWTKDEEDKLINLYPEISNKELCKIFGRSLGSINQKRVQLKLRKSRKYRKRYCKNNQVNYLKNKPHQRIGTKHNKETKKKISEAKKGKITWNKNMKKEELKKHYPNGWNTPIMKGKNNPSWKEKVKLKCKECNNNYKKIPSVSAYSNFCSLKCKLEYYSKKFLGKGNPNSMMNKHEQMFKIYMKIKDEEIVHRYYLGRYIVDFVNLNKKIVYEIDGNNKNLKTKYQIKRDKFIKGLGWKIIRFTHLDVERLFKKVRNNDNR